MTEKHHVQTSVAEASQPAAGTLLTLVFAVFLLRIFAWADAELWYDEVLTFQRFMLPYFQEPAQTLRDYPIANNHLLFTWLEIWWVRLLGGMFNEFLFRLPSLLFGLLTLTLVVCHWRRVLGLPLASLGALTLAISPVFAGYAYQMRGYSLSLLLAAVAISGLLDLSQGAHPWRGQALLLLAGVLLPLVMPTNLLLAPVVVVLGAAMLREQGKCWLTVARQLLAWCVGTLLGAAYYLTIWEQFRRALAEPDGWSSAWLVAGNVLLAMVVHGGVQGACVLAWTWRAARDRRWSAWRPVVAGLLAVAGVVAVGLLLGRSGHAPFPRVFLLLLVPVTFLLLWLGRRLHSEQQPRRLVPIAVVTLVAGILVERVAEGVTDMQLKRGYVPDNLLQQYYRGANDLRAIAEDKSLQVCNAIVITDAYDMMSASFYLGLLRAPDQQGLVIGSQMLETSSSWLPEAPGRKLVVAPQETAARELFRRARLATSEKAEVREVWRAPSGRRGVYELTKR